MIESAFNSHGYITLINNSRSIFFGQGGVLYGRSVQIGGDIESQAGDVNFVHSVLRQDEISRYCFDFGRGRPAYETQTYQLVRREAIPANNQFITGTLV